jgi:hypothetical protein
LTVETVGSTARAMRDRAALEEELATVAVAARRRRSVDLFLRAAIEGFCWAVLSGVCVKLLWDSRRIPLFFWPLALLDLFLIWDAARAWRKAQASLRHEVVLEARLRELRSTLGIDP